ncbi:appr-1-p processing enzyme family protein [Fusobacterium animalis ATCC 51191]|uniref:Appr-1-p processing enzyme family protein n=1 Tax=Fusobacterium animalis ATCC 51191 TaxID=997347 RepID=F9ERA7_9FUSO|nr:appr-1-p processing enzyme family protein [Fusobacterium animalis ATCC 51191]
MLEYKKGDIFESDAVALVNPVNTEGIMGKGLAYQFKKRFPNNFKLYSEKCLNGSFKIGSPLVWINENNKIIINFPTKKTWKENSKIEYIRIGLEKLTELLVELNLDSIAIPPIGAGNGKLDWDLVLDEIEKFNKKISGNIKVSVYVPTSDVFKLSKGHYLLVYALLEMYKQGIMKSEINDLSFQKIVFLGDRNNYFKFSKNKKGPFSKLLTLQYNEIKEYSRIRKMNLNEIKEEMLKLNISKSLEKKRKI